MVCKKWEKNIFKKVFAQNLHTLVQLMKCNSLLNIQCSQMLSSSSLSRHNYVERLYFATTRNGRCSSHVFENDMVVTASMISRTSNMAKARTGNRWNSVWRSGQAGLRVFLQTAADAIACHLQRVVILATFDISSFGIECLASGVHR